MCANRIRVVLFDLDGTIVDSEPLAYEVISKRFSEWKLPLTEKDIHYCTGRTWRSALQYLFNKLESSLPPLPIEETLDQLKREYREVLEARLPEVPGAARFIKELSSKYELGLVSGSDRRDIELVLKGLGIFDCFKVYLGSEDYKEGKPSPEGYTKALEVLGAHPNESLVFEDSIPGIQAARGAGMRVIAVTSTNHMNQDLSLADGHLNDFQKATPSWMEAQF